MLKFEIIHINNIEAQKQYITEVNDFYNKISVTDDANLFINFPYNNYDICLGVYYMRILSGNSIVGIGIFYPMARKLMYLRNFYICKDFRANGSFVKSINYFVEYFKKIHVIRIIIFIDSKDQLLIRATCREGFKVASTYHEFTLLELDWS